MRNTKTIIFVLSLLLVFAFSACGKTATNSLDVPDVLQKTVGTVSSTYTSTGITDGKGYTSILTKTFTDTTEADYIELMEHYQSASTGTDDNGSLLFDWGWLNVTSATDNSSITITAYFK